MARKLRVQMVLALAYVLVAKAFVLLKEILFAHHFGTSESLDAFVLASTLVTQIPIAVTAGAALLFVPRLILHHENRQLIPQINAISIFGALLCFASVWLTGPWLVGVMAGNMNLETRELSLALVRELSPLAGLTFLSGMLAIRVLSNSSQFATLAESLPSIGIVMLLILPVIASGVDRLTIGIIVGTFVHLMALIIYVARTEKRLGGIALPSKDGIWSEAAIGIVFVTSGQILFMTGVIWDQFAAAQMQQGTIAAVGYANRIAAIGIVFGAIVVGRTILPMLSDLIRLEGAAVARIQAFRMMRNAIVLGTLAAAAAYPVVPHFVVLVFERGMFSAEDSLRVSSLLQILLLQFPFFLAGIVAVQFLAATKAYAVQFLATLSGIAVKIVVLFTTSKILQEHSIAWSTVAMYLTTFSVLSLAMLVSARGEAGNTV